MTVSQNGHHASGDTPYRRQCHRPDCQQWFSTTGKPQKLYCSEDCRRKALQERRRERHIAKQRGVSIEHVEPDASIELPALVAKAIREDWPISSEIRQTLPQTMFSIAEDDDAKPSDRVNAARSIVAMKEQSLTLLRIVAQSQQEQPPERPTSIISIQTMQNVLASPDACLALQHLQEQCINQGR